MKAYRDDNGKVTLFRPDMNMKRMNNSAQRLALPVRASSYTMASSGITHMISNRPSAVTPSSSSSRSSSRLTSTGSLGSLGTAYTSVLR